MTEQEALIYAAVYEIERNHGADYVEAAQRAWRAISEIRWKLRARKAKGGDA